MLECDRSPTTHRCTPTGNDAEDGDDSDEAVAVATKKKMDMKIADDGSSSGSNGLDPEYACLSR
jgi:hypothetical protein